MQKCVSNIVLLLFLSTTMMVRAQEETSLLTRADSLYSKKKYAEAQQIYYQLFEKGYFTAASLLKMAFVYEGLDDTPRALFFLGKYYNQTEDPKAYDKIMVLSNAHNLSGYELSDWDKVLLWLEKRLVVTVLLLALASVLTLSLAFVSRKKSMPGVKVAFGVLTLVLLGTLVAVVDFGQPIRRGVISRQAYLMAGPSAGANLMTILDEGNQVPVLDTQDVWVKVSWKDKTGYIKKSDLLVH